MPLCGALLSHLSILEQSTSSENLKVFHLLVLLGQVGRFWAVQAEEAKETSCSNTRRAQTLIQSSGSLRLSLVLRSFLEARGLRDLGQ